LRDQGLAAAAAAVADEVDAPLDVFPEPHKAALVGRIQEPHALGDGDGARVAVSSQRFRRTIEGHADFHRRVALAPHVPHLVPAIAEPHADARGGLDDPASPLVVEDMKRVLERERRLLDEDAPQLGLALGEKGHDKIFLDIHVLVEKFGEGLLIQVRANAHHRELEETRHRRRHAVDG
jgi:hypothetical protein